MTDQTVRGPLVCHETGLRRGLKPRHLQLIALGGIGADASIRAASLSSICDDRYGVKTQHR